MAQDVSVKTAFPFILVLTVYMICIMASLAMMASPVLDFVDPRILKWPALWVTVGTFWGIFAVPRYFICRWLYFLGLWLMKGDIARFRQTTTIIDELKALKRPEGAMMTFAALVSVLIACAIAWPVVIFFEILHWRDKPR